MLSTTSFFVDTTIVIIVNNIVAIVVINTSDVININNPYNERTCTGPAAEKERTRKAASRSATTATVLGDQALKR